MKNIMYCYSLYLILNYFTRSSSAIQARSDTEQQQQAVISAHVTQIVASSNDFNPLGPRVMCSFLPHDFLECKEPIDHHDNNTAKAEKGYGCLRFGGSTYEEVEHTKVQCTVFPDIDCYGPRTFYRDGIPCVRYTDHYFVTTLVYSILLGFLGMDRFCLGKSDSTQSKKYFANIHKNNDT